jgi:hypothetical protein
MKDDLNELEFAGRVRNVLNQGTTGLDQKAALRLYEARCDALRHQAAPVAALSLAGISRSLTDSLQNHYRGILAFMALVVGAAGVQFWHNLQQADEMAEIDAALLSDEVSPAAYTDQGFVEWLHHLSEQDDESLSE